MKLTKISTARYRLVEGNVTIEGSLDVIGDRLMNLGLLCSEELEEALMDMSARGTNVAHFGLYVKEAMAGNTTYGFMFSMKEAA